MLSKSVKVNKIPHLFIPSIFILHVVFEIRAIYVVSKLLVDFTGESNTVDGPSKPRGSYD
jgi:hypothetical protein